MGRNEIKTALLGILSFLDYALGFHDLFAGLFDKLFVILNSILKNSLKVL
jgi:hypothetical protein